MSDSTQADRVSDGRVVLLGDDVSMAQTSVRKYLTKLRNNYRHAVRRGDREHFATSHLRKFDAYLELYERLGGDPDEIEDPITSLNEGGAR